MDMPFLFFNLVPDCQLIAIWRLGNDKKRFVQPEIDMLQEEAIEESTSSWKAQVLIVINER